MKPCVRGIYAFEDEECEEWREAIVKYNGIPKFDTKQQCESFLRKYCTRGSNPEFPYLQHVFTMLADRRQIMEHLVPKMEYYDKKYPFQHRQVEALNRFRTSPGDQVLKDIEYRLNLKFHQKLNRESTMNTLNYLFEHMRCGIFVMIRARKVVLFVPFVNRDYENNWSSHLKFDVHSNKMEDYYHEKRNHYRRENIIPDVNKWWANGNIICNEHCRPNVREEETQYWGDQFLTQLRDMLEDACLHREMQDCEFFINKRDYPHLKNNLTEPYGFLFDKDDKLDNDDMPLGRELYSTYAPIMSFYCSKRFADIPFPCSEDWEAATGKVFPPSFSHSHCRNCNCGDAMDCKNEWECYCPTQYHGVKGARDLFTAENFKKFAKPFQEKINTAFFRGTATGGGTTMETNQRIHLAFLSNTWKHDAQYNDPVPYLDAEVTAWNLRDKKIAGHPMTFLRKQKYNFKAGKQHYIPIYDQSKFKYILYVEGHCAANRYAFLMRLGSVILKVESKCVADEMWYFPMLQPYVDHVPVSADLSDLAAQIEWCRNHDDECQQIVQNALQLYENFVSKEAIRDYMQLITSEISKRFVPTPSWYTRPSSKCSPFHISPKPEYCFIQNGVEQFCQQCIQRRSSLTSTTQPKSTPTIKRCSKCRHKTCICR